jgi:hypothetical protein
VADSLRITRNEVDTARRMTTGNVAAKMADFSSALNLVYGWLEKADRVGESDAHVQQMLPISLRHLTRRTGELDAACAAEGA